MGAFCMKQQRTFNSLKKFKIKIKISKTYNIQWYHSHAGLIWPDFNK